MHGMASSPDAPGDDPCTVTGIRAIDEPGEELAELGDHRRLQPGEPAEGPPGRAPLVRAIRHRGASRLGTGPDGVRPRGWIRIAVPPGQLEDFIRAVRQAARDTDAEYQALMARRQEWAQRDTHAQRERQADPARRARLAEDQARIDAVLAQTGQ